MVRRWFFLLWLLAGLVGHHTAAAKAPAQVRVGVILDLKSVTGASFRTGIQMAVEDYYSSHSNSTTRVELHFRDSSGDALAAVSAAVDLIKNAQVQAIIGPRTSEETEFVAYVGSRAQVPVLSYSATSPALSPAQSGAPYLVRTCADDALQAATIADVLGSFAWREAVLVHEDSSFDAAIVPALDDALRGAGAALAHREAVPAGASDDRLDAVLYRVKALPTRVFIVHTSPSLAPRLFRRAKKAGMMSEGYVWIATASLGGEVGAMSPSDIDAMHGVLFVRPYVHPTSQVKDFVERFMARIRREDATSQDPTVPMLWAYDTAWAVAAAAEAAGISGSAFRPPPSNTTTVTELDQLGVSATGARFLKAVLDTTFHGLAGEFRLMDGQLIKPLYEIVNVVGKGTTTVGFRRPNYGISQELATNSGGGLKAILWPGAELSSAGRAPKGWAASPTGRELVIAVPVKHGFQQFVELSTDASGRRKISGFCIDVFDAAMKSLNQPVQYRYEPFNITATDLSYDNLINMVPQKKADAVVGDVSITVSRMDKVDFTMPFTESGWSMVTAVNPRSSTSMFFFLKPLTPDLWIVSVAAFIFTGFVIWVIEHRINPDFRGTPIQQLGTIFHYSFTTLVFAHREDVRSNLSKFLMVIWLFAVLILTSSYTANLTSLLTVEKLQPAVTDIYDLIENGDYVGYQEGSYVADELVKMNFDRRKLRSYTSPAEYAEALSKGSANGGVAAVFDELPYLRLFLSQYCNSYAMVGPVYKGTGFGFVFAKGSPVAAEVSRGIVALSGDDEMARIERKWFGAQGDCDGDDDTSNVSLSLWNFSGLFIITGSASTLMLIIYVVMFFYRERGELGAAEPGAGSVSMKRVRAWLHHYDTKDLTAPSFKRQLSRDGSPSRIRRDRDDEQDDEAIEMRDTGGPAAATPPSEHRRLGEFITPERTASGEFITPFEQRLGEAGAGSSTERRPSTPERRPATPERRAPAPERRVSLILPPSTERKNQPLSP
ncbi:hypothetical protein ACP4OV_000805 [Aristida adscensionis]